MKNQTIIKRYARALLSLGVENNQLDQYGLELENLAQAIKASGQLATITSPVLPREVRKNMVAAILAKADFSPMVNNFINLLMDKNRFNDLIEISDAYKVLADFKNGIIRAKLTSASALEEAEIESIKTALSKFTGKKIKINLIEEPKIIGGLIAKLGDLTIDGSVRTQINKL
ncbi:MAG: ATP synthase F1 subunit delta, partial [Candidatus Adiutrix sp.]